MPHSRYTEAVTKWPLLFFYYICALKYSMKYLLGIISFLILSLSCIAQEWAVVNTSSAFLRAEPDYESALESQSLMGTVLRIKASERYWRQVEAPDYDNVWVNEGALAIMTAAQKDAYLAAPKYIYTADFGRIYTYATADSVPIGDIILGDIIMKGGKTNGEWTSVKTASGEEGWVPRESVEDYDTWANSRKPTRTKLWKTAYRFLGVPYMWGGNTIKHFDCSGLTKYVYMLNGLLLPRNASQQIKCGKEIPYDFDEMLPGDLLFFGTKNADGSIRSVTHVAMYVGGGCIIHSSQVVKINSLVDGADFPNYGREPIAVRRMLGEQGPEKGVSKVAEKPWYFKK